MVLDFYSDGVLGMSTYVVNSVEPGMVMVFVAAVMLTVFVVAVVVTVTGGRENREVQKDWAAGRVETREATAPRGPAHCAVETSKAMLPRRINLVKCILIYRWQRSLSKI